LLVAAGTLLASFLGLICIYRACCRYAQAERAALAAAWVTLGTTIVYYNAIETSMAHGIGTAVVAVLLACWLRTYASDRYGRWFAVGVLVGLATLMRWQLATLAILPTAETCLHLMRRGTRDLLSAMTRLAVAGIGMVLAFLPQMIAWKCVYGEWLVAPLPVEPHWLSPALSELVWSENRSLLYWTPLAIVLVSASAAASWYAGTYTATGNDDVDSRCNGPACLSDPLRILLVAFLLQMYLVAALWGRPGVYLGSAFGMRHLTESLVLLAPGLAWGLERLPVQWRRCLRLAGWLLVVWNLLLICQYRYGFLPPDAGASFAKLISNARWMIRHRPWLVLTHAIVAPSVMAALLAGKMTLPRWVRTTSRLDDSHSGSCPQSSSPLGAAS
jgi:hypothetical protein